MNYTRMDSPVGPLSIAGDDAGLCFILFGSGKRAAGPRPDWRESDRGVVRETVRQLKAYFARKLTRFDLPLTPAGTPFQLDVWRELQQIPYGTRDLLWRAGKPHRQAAGVARGRRRQWRQPNPHRGPLPSGDRQQRQADRLRRRTGDQRSPARTRAQSACVNHENHGAAGGHNQRISARLAEDGSLEEAAGNSPGREAGVGWAMKTSAEGAAHHLCAGPSDLDFMWSPTPPLRAGLFSAGASRLELSYFVVPRIIVVHQKLCSKNTKLRRSTTKSTGVAQRIQAHLLGNRMYGSPFVPQDISGIARCFKPSTLEGRPAKTQIELSHPQF